jgi:putative ABC transport system ATP-binding protein
VVVVGPSGSGKTSLLRLLNRLDEPSAGEIFLDGHPIGDIPVRRLRRRVGFVFQTPVMFPGTVHDNLQFAVRWADATQTAASIDEDALLQSVGLDSSYISRIAGDLSGGERQRVAVARALVARPEVLLLDEPTAALDGQVALHLVRMLAGLCHSVRISIVMVTHRIEEVEAVATYVIECREGRIVRAENCQENSGIADARRSVANTCSSHPGEQRG